MNNTKEFIIYNSLKLFSERGYDGVSMRDIASAVGIKGASLYNHFRSKEDIYNSIINEMTRRYHSAVTKIQVPHGEMNEVVNQYIQLSEDSLIVIAKELFLYFLKDDFASKFRRLLTIEQYRSSKAKDILQGFYINGPIQFESTLFHNMMEQNRFKKSDPYIMAIHFYSPIFLLLYNYDNLPDKENEALSILENHIKQFCYIYTVI